MKFFVTIFLWIPFLGSAQQLSVQNLRCGNEQNPIGIAVANPLLAWQLHSARRNVSQSAYRILVADDSLLLNKDIGNIWDSKKMTGSTSINVRYGGKVLEAAKIYYWKVMVWDNLKNRTTWSNIFFWQMGLIKRTDWKNARWIAYDKIEDSNIVVLPVDGTPDKHNENNILPLLRKDFKVKKKLANATMFISGLGHFELSINGQKTGENFLDPGWVKYDKEALYIGFDVTGQLQQGDNTIGVMLGNGFYYVPPVKKRFRKLKSAFGFPKMIARLVLEYADGTSEDIVTDTSWRATPGPIVFSSIYGGEDYNARLEQQGWDRPGFDAGKWQQAILVDGPPLLSPQTARPLQVFNVFPPVAAHKAANGDWVFDMAQNASGIIELEVKGNKGDTVRITPGELLDNNAVAQKPTGSPYYFQYILKGDGIEKWRPRFTYYGFRYLQVSGAAYDTDKDSAGTRLLSINSLHTRNAAETVGSFSCSNDLFNQTYNLIDWAVKSNMASVFTDCPHREKLGWLEQAHLMTPSVRYMYDINTLCTKMMNDMRQSQHTTGLVTEIVPQYVHFSWGGDMFQDSPEWGMSSVLLPWYAYQWYGNRQTLEDAYPMMKNYLAYLKTKADNNILRQGLGDWYDLGPKPPGVSQLTPMGVTGTAIYYHGLTTFKETATLLGKKKDAADAGLLARQVKQSFNDSFLNKQTLQYATGSQTANAMALYMKLVPDSLRQAVLQNFVSNIIDSNYRLSAGDIGYRYVLRVLEEEGYSDIIYKMNNRSDVPGYGYQIAKGATALTESWQALPTVSNNHLMLGHLMEWFYSGLAGIRQSKDGIAFKTFEIAPQVVGDISAAKASYVSPYGLVESSWQLKDNVFELDVTVPANTTATIYIPAAPTAIIHERGQRIKPLRYTAHEQAVVKVGSGKYSFLVK